MIGDKLNILFVSSECAPLCKTGGLADVVGALPKALSKLSVTSSIILPYYSTLPKYIKDKSTLIASFTITLGWKEQYAGLMTTLFRGRRYYFIDNQDYFYRDRLYGYYEDTERYLFFSLAVLEALKHIKDNFDIIHCNDWQSAFIPMALNKFYSKTMGYQKIKTVLTIHNLRFQGMIKMSDFIDMMSLNGRETWLGEVFHNNQASMLKAGIFHADAVTTVSPNYAEEIKNAFYGESFEGYINEASHKLSGIINGIDTVSFKPESDIKIYSRYISYHNKYKNKEALCDEYSLKNTQSMMIGMVTRLDSQKGLDLVEYAIDKLMHLNINFVLLGNGDKEIEAKFHQIEKTYSEKARCFIMYDESLARKIYAACDVFLMPSLFEPCGLGQLIAMRYGALPIVRETGGLKDTVTPYNKITGAGTGFSFANYNGDELVATVNMAYDVFNNNKKHFTAMAIRAMEKDFSWKESAKKYKDLYLGLFNKKS